MNLSGSYNSTHNKLSRARLCSPPRGVSKAVAVEGFWFRDDQPSHVEMW